MPDRFATRKKPMYPISEGLERYLADYSRAFRLPVSYTRLAEWEESISLEDEEGNDTLWRTVIYRPEVWKRLSKHLTAIYAMLKTEGDSSFVNHLYADRVDYCTFGNSNPFRIRIVNAYNDNQDYYYIKKVDASRIYGLELEHLLSPNRMHYLVADDLLVEEHVVGIPGDVFVRDWLHQTTIPPIRLAKELVKFNERCFRRLLGDMRSYNFVVDLTPDCEGTHVRLRPMDFDQQSYSGRLNFYRPQFFKENNELVQFCVAHLNPQTARQYQVEEQAVIFRRIELVRERVNHLINCMSEAPISTDEKVHQLRDAMASEHQNRNFLRCTRMGDILRESLIQVRENVQRQRERAGDIFSRTG